MEGFDLELGSGVLEGSALLMLRSLKNWGAWVAQSSICLQLRS